MSDQQKRLAWAIDEIRRESADLPSHVFAERLIALGAYIGEHKHDWSSDLGGGWGITIDTFPSETVYVCRNGCGKATHDPITGLECTICSAMHGSAKQ